MPNCTKELFNYPAFGRRKIEASFGGGHVSSDAGIMFLGLTPMPVRKLQ